MFFQGVSSVLLLDRSGNDMLCSILFFSLGFDVLTDYFSWYPSCRQKAETLAPECFLPELFPYFFCSFWNWIIDNFYSIFYHHDQVILHQIHWMCIVIHIFHKTSPFLNNYLIDCFYYTMVFATKQMFFLFFCNSSPTCRGRRILAIYYVKILLANAYSFLVLKYEIWNGYFPLNNK